MEKEFRFKRGDRAQIARICGLTTAELSQALRTTTNLEVGEKIRAAAQSLGYDVDVRVKRVIVEIQPSEVI